MSTYIQWSLFGKDLSGTTLSEKKVYDPPQRIHYDMPEMSKEV